MPLELLDAVEWVDVHTNHRDSGRASMTGSFGRYRGTRVLGPPGRRRRNIGTVTFDAWGGLRLLHRLQEGNRNEVWHGDLVGRSVAVRRSARPAASLDWELDTLVRVADHSVRVAEVIAADDGRRLVDGIVVQRWIDGRQPQSEADWRLVAAALERVHAVEVDQRPGAAVVTELDRLGRSVDADLSAVPQDVADVVLEVFGSMTDVPVSLIHGDTGPSNILIDEGDDVWLLDWDESRVDLTWHDLSNLGVQILDRAQHTRAVVLSHAWEAVNAWVVEPDYARRRFAQLQAMVNPDRPRR